MADPFQTTGHTWSTQQSPHLQRAYILATFIGETLEHRQTPEAGILNPFTHLPREEQNAIFDLLKALRKT